MTEPIEKPAQIHAPWDPDVVAALNDFQALEHLHPFTCANGCGVLTAHTDGWFCPCGYRQTWAWAVMADRSSPFWKDPLERFFQRGERCAYGLTA